MVRPLQQIDRLDEFAANTGTLLKRCLNQQVGEQGCALAEHALATTDIDHCSRALLSRYDPLQTQPGRCAQACHQHQSDGITPNQRLRQSGV